MVACSRRRCASSSGSSVIGCSATMRKERLRKRNTPSTPLVFQGLTASSGPMNISYRRMLSAPYSRMTSSGLTTFFNDLDILAGNSVSFSPVSAWKAPSVRCSTCSIGTSAPRASL
ncbi:MAG: hypothetical protein BWX70_02724 [Verrucomicrobia bacterium ADurb.Bin070]|nr:MAG: hypothetical protein BWX70_02724 [Verrucomicrobia bacterium ADurb.Bin070]